MFPPYYFYWFRIDNKTWLNPDWIRRQWTQHTIVVKIKVKRVPLWIRYSTFFKGESLELQSLHLNYSPYTWITVPTLELQSLHLNYSPYTWITVPTLELQSLNLKPPWLSYYVVFDRLQLFQYKHLFRSFFT